MKKILVAFKETLIRGIVFMVPLMVILILIDKVLDKLKELAIPIADMLPYHSLFGIGRAYWAVFLILLALGLFMGLIARLRIAAKISNWLEDHLLHRLPGYGFMKHMGESMIGADKGSAYKVVLLKNEDSLQLAYAIEEVTDDLVAVYVPSVPNAFEGELLYVSKERIKETAISYKDSIKLIHCQGRGSKKILSGKI
ncbi:MAG: DUF502 domain-containing protein [Cytophaga sp.]|uniref:DUF502 domain-containing protein n=1 Tax=Cytophaga sp. TaxID=29535 RepID=UPI003F80EF45